MNLIECKNLSIGYDNNAIIENIDLTIEEGSHLYIIGENGSGKSTFVKSILKLQKPICGSVEYCRHLKQNEIGYLPQQSTIQRGFPASVYEIVISGCLNRSGIGVFYNKKCKKRALHNMELLGIDDIKQKSYQELSGGLQQRVLLARALCASSKALLLDEPVTGLDPKATNDLYALIEKLNREYKITVITVSHDLNAAQKYASHILHFTKNNYFFGTANDYNNSDFYKQLITFKESD